MPITNFVIICENIKRKDGQISLINPMPSRSFISFPNEFTFNFAFGVSDVKKNEHVNVRVDFIYNGTVIQSDIVNDDILNHSENYIDGFFHGDMEATDIEKPGLYTLSVTCKGEDNVESTSSAVIIIRKRDMLYE